MAILMSIPSFNINPDNITSDNVKYENAERPELTNVSQAINDLFGSKVDKEEGKGLSTNDFTDEDKQRLEDVTEQIIFSSYREFPNLGQINKLYIDKETNISYLWNPTQQVYISVAFEADQYQIQCSL